MNESIRGYATACGLISAGSAGATASPRLTDELIGLSRVLDGADELRWALADTSLAVSTRKAIITELLTGKLDSLAVKLVSFVIGHDNPTEVITNLDWVVDQVANVNLALAKSQDISPSILDDTLIGPSVGRSETRNRVGGFAQAAFSTLETEAAIYEVEDELFRLARVVQGNLDLRVALTDWNRTPTQRANIADELLGNKVTPVTRWIVLYALKAGNPGNLVLLLDWLVGQAAQERNWRVGEVRCRQVPEADQVERMGRAMAQSVGHDVELRVVIDDSVIGGAQITVGDYVIDATIRRKLDEMHQFISDQRATGRN